MGTLVNVKAPDVLIDVSDSFSPSRLRWLAPLGLHLAPEAFHGSVIPTVAFPAHAHRKTILLCHLAVIFGTILASTVRMENAAVYIAGMIHGIL